jgi:hypothetical protein
VEEFEVGVFWVFFGDPRKGTEEGGQLVSIWVFGGTYLLYCPIWGGLESEWARGFTKNIL